MNSPSKNLIMVNINYVGRRRIYEEAQRITKVYVLNNELWMRFDIAGMAFSKYGGALNNNDGRVICN